MWPLTTSLSADDTIPIAPLSSPAMNHAITGIDHDSTVLSVTASGPNNHVSLLPIPPCFQFRSSIPTNIPEWILTPLLFGSLLFFSTDGHSFVVLYIATYFSCTKFILAWQPNVVVIRRRFFLHRYFPLWLDSNKGSSTDGLSHPNLRSAVICSLPGSCLSVFLYITALVSDFPN